MYLAIDFGITNTDIIVSSDGENKEFFSVESENITDSFFYKIFSHCGIQVNEINEIAITGGKSSSFKDTLDTVSYTHLTLPTKA